MELEAGVFQNRIRIMLIWGSRSKAHTKKTGRFYCPECDGYRQYELKHAKQYFTLYFIRTFPTEDLGEYVECCACKSTFKTSILEHDPEKKAEEFKQLYLSATLDIIVNVAIDNRNIEDVDIGNIILCFQRATNLQIEKDHLLETIQRVKHSDFSVQEIARSISPYLSDNGKESILRAAIEIGKSNGPIDNLQLPILLQLADDLLLPKAYSKAIFIEEDIIRQ